jgi:hypothetical protein
VLADVVNEVLNGRVFLAGEEGCSLAQLHTPSY